MDPSTDSRTETAQIRNAQASVLLNRYLDVLAWNHTILIHRAEILSAFQTLVTDFEAVFGDEAAQGEGHNRSDDYVGVFACEAMGNLFTVKSLGIEEGIAHIALMRRAAKIFLDRNCNPQSFIGCPVIKILLTNPLREAEAWIQVMEEQAEKVIAMGGSKLELLIDESESSADFRERVLSFVPVSRGELLALHAPKKFSE